MNSRAYTSGFNFKGSDQQKKVGKLSGGERNRLHLAKLLRTGGNLLLLDEPTNDLDVDTLRALEEALLSFAGCAVVISHDRWFLDRIATHVLAFEGDSQVDVVRGQLRGLRGAPPRAARRRGRPPAPHHLQAAHAHLSARRERVAYAARLLGARRLRLAALRLRVRAAFLAASLRLLSRLRTRSRMASLADAGRRARLRERLGLLPFLSSRRPRCLATFLRTPWRAVVEESSLACLGHGRLPARRQSPPSCPMAADVCITEYTDPGCPWAYSAEPFRRRLTLALRRPLEWRVQLVGLAESPDEYVEKGFTPEKQAARLRLDRARPRHADRHARCARAWRPPSRPAAPSWPPACTRPRPMRALLRRLRVRHFSGQLLDEPETIHGRRARRGHRPRRPRSLDGRATTSRRRCARTWPPRATR